MSTGLDRRTRRVMSKRHMDFRIAVPPGHVMSLVDSDSKTERKSDGKRGLQGVDPAVV
jgi:hypothetical protein